MSDLLVVDWDSFFPNPMDGGDLTREALLYDWAHSESSLGIDILWPVRAFTFLINERPLPRCAGFEGFWERVAIRPGTRLLVADSNLWAGRLHPPDKPWSSFRSVWLYDAHHDSGGYHGRTVEQWRAGGVLTCEDWMLAHAELGSRLHVRYPWWKTRWQDAEPEPAVPVDRAPDDGSSPGVVFDAVFACRSGAWVPPWCDDQFAAFTASFPGEVTQIDDSVLLRAFDSAEIAVTVEATRTTFAAADTDWPRPVTDPTDVSTRDTT